MLGSLNVLADFTNKCAAFDLRALSESAADIYQLPERSVSFMNTSAIDSCEFPACPVLCPVSDRMNTCWSQGWAAHVEHLLTWADTQPVAHSTAKLHAAITKQLSTQEPHKAGASTWRGEKNRCVSAEGTVPSQLQSTLFTCGRGQATSRRESKVDNISGQSKASITYFQQTP